MVWNTDASALVICRGSSHLGVFTEVRDVSEHFFTVHRGIGFPHTHCPCLQACKLSFTLSHAGGVGNTAALLFLSSAQGPGPVHVIVGTHNFWEVLERVQWWNFTGPMDTSFLPACAHRFITYCDA